MVLLKTSFTDFSLSQCLNHTLQSDRYSDLNEALYSNHVMLLSPDFEMLGLSMMLGNKFHCCNKKNCDWRFQALSGTYAKHCSVL